MPACRIGTRLPGYDTIIIGGAMAYTFALAKGKKVGDSLSEPDKVPMAREALKKAEEKGVNFLLPVDTLITDAFDFDAAFEGGQLVLVESADSLKFGILNSHAGTSHGGHVVNEVGPVHLSLMVCRQLLEGMPCNAPYTEDDSCVLDHSIRIEQFGSHGTYLRPDGVDREFVEPVGDYGFGVVIEEDQNFFIVRVARRRIVECGEVEGRGVPENREVVPRGLQFSKEG